MQKLATLPEEGSAKRVLYNVTYGRPEFRPHGAGCDDEVQQCRCGGDETEGKRSAGEMF